MAVSTYFPKSNSVRLNIFKQSITSLVQCHLNTLIFLVDDGSVDKTHLDWVRATPNISSTITIVERPHNGGISKCKNTCIKQILDAGFDYGILVDDDVIFDSTIFNDLFIEQLNIPQHHHVSVQLDKRAECQSLPVPKLISITSNFGCFFSFSKTVIDNIGYFKIYPYQYGYEHQNFSERILRSGLIPHFLGLAPQTCPISLHPDSTSNKSMVLDPTGVSQNKVIWDAEKHDLQLYYPFVD